MNLFLSTRHLTEAKEDHLTEFLASALDADDDFRRAYASTVLESYAKQKGWDSVEIRAVNTQPKIYLDAHCQPDLMLTLADGHVIGCEHKLDAPETPGETVLATGECAPALQLERYLALPDVHGVAYFRSWWQAPDEGVLNHPLYIRPSSGRKHFLWSDVYEPLQRGSSIVSQWLREAFERLGFTPPHPFIGELEDPDDKVRAESRENLKKLWNPARSRLRQMGWSIESGSICQLYLKGNPGSNAEMIYVSPCEPGGRILLVRVTPRDPEKAGEVAARLQSTPGPGSLPSGVEVQMVDVRRAGGARRTVDVKIPFAKLLNGANGVPEIESRLSDYVCSIAELSC